jgi:hypothetical protein
VTFEALRSIVFDPQVDHSPVPRRSVAVAGVVAVENNKWISVAVVTHTDPRTTSSA